MYLVNDIVKNLYDTIRYKYGDRLNVLGFNSNRYDLLFNSEYSTNILCKNAIGDAYVSKNI